MEGRGRPSACDPAGTRTAIRLGVILPRACRRAAVVVAKPLHGRRELPNILGMKEIEKVDKRHYLHFATTPSCSGQV